MRAPLSWIRDFTPVDAPVAEEAPRHCIRDHDPAIGAEDHQPGGNLLDDRREARPPGY